MPLHLDSRDVDPRVRFENKVSYTKYLGNDKGYKDIQNQFAADKNYKFKVDDSDVQKLEQDIDNLEAKVFTFTLLKKKNS